ncbi:hypothetical protein NBRC10512_007365 [Rhodotorula toruloides]|uniref:RHTO0S12e02190g1_1 n=2 Tax=Rhodotorula toruloides TaxID=5286 RepID=A0A061BA84_RHOTO|nr:uncharacterized protein RHTO_07586 [Rhodotorula toruloides NP11]EMS23244.1 hypothetical protein RHTO_07586 [Rhodotorula toruloides NP11]CDR46263.1 RHTO0S12e02190g1_1 [Rhodotorula toruloides]
MPFARDGYELAPNSLHYDGPRAPHSLLQSRLRTSAAILIATLLCASLARLWLVEGTLYAELAALRAEAAVALRATDSSAATLASAGLRRGSLRTVVGGRILGPQYHSKGCSSTEFLAAVADIQVDPDGASRNPPTDATYSLSSFDFSFRLPHCPQPHIFTRLEACDLLENGFGGVLLRGDSLMRHLTNALFLILRDRPDGAVQDPEARQVCWGDRLFDDKKDCRKVALFDTQDLLLDGEPVCNGKVWLRYEQLPCPVEPSRYVPTYLDWRDQMPPSRSGLSPAIIQSFGLHCHFLPFIPRFGIFKPLFAHAATAFPRPLLLWIGINAPGLNKPPQYLKEQGGDQVLRYNQIIAEELDGMQTSSETAAEGKMAVLETYGMTDGAKSFDGTHYMWNVNMEKAQLLLNYLDLLWGEVRDAGGLWNRTQLCPLGKGNYQCSFGD